ncbi:MAG TPA: DUF4097 family beta strand repeat-containing protein [Terriglobales bacterium]
MRRIVLFAAFLLILSPLARAEEWSKTYTITGQPDLRVQTSDATLQVDTWDQHTIEARVSTEGYKIGEHGIQIFEHQTGDMVEIEVRYPYHSFNFDIGSHHRRVEVVIHMPREGRLNLRTGDGRIRLANFKGEIETRSGDGHQEISSVDGILRAHSGDGRIVADGRFDGLDVSSGDGRIEVTARRGSTIARSWSLRAGDGRINLLVPEDLAADVDFHTRDGHLDVDVPVTVTGRMGSKNIHGKMNGGGNLLTIHTGDGSIRVQRS